MNVDHSLAFWRGLLVNFFSYAIASTGGTHAQNWRYKTVSCVVDKTSSFVTKVDSMLDVQVDKQVSSAIRVQPSKNVLYNVICFLFLVFEMYCSTLCKSVHTFLQVFDLTLNLQRSSLHYDVLAFLMSAWIHIVEKCCENSSVSLIWFSTFKDFFFGSWTTSFWNA